MKALFKLTALLMIVLVIASCKKDKDKDDVKPKAGSFMYDGKEYALSQGFLENWGEWWAEEGFNIDLNLFSDGIEIFMDEDYAELTGKGHGMFFEMFSSKSDELVPGDYLFDDESLTPGTFEFGIIVMD